jgi:protein-disulfide isomerase
MTSQQAAQTRRQRRLAERVARHDERRRPHQVRRRLGLGSLSALGLIGGLVVVAVAVALGATRTPAPAVTDTPIVAVARAPAGLVSDGFALGRADAPVTIDLYEDFQCPACQSWGKTVFPSLVANELAAGAVRVVFHDLAFLGPESTDAGRAAYAAAQQGRFWDMWATLYANQGRENSGAFSADRLVAMADQIGLDVTRFEADMASAAAQDAIAASRSDANMIGISSTPTLVIRGQAYVGVIAYEDIAAAIVAAAR